MTSQSKDLLIKYYLIVFFSSLNSPATRRELITISAAVMGIEFAYAAETAFVSPTLLKIGVSQSHMTLIWCLSPLVGFFLTPILGSLSDRCKSALGRRRPFIILLSVGVVLGLLLVPNGKALGKMMGDQYYDKEVDAPSGRIFLQNQESQAFSSNLTDYDDYGESSGPPADLYTYHPWGIFFTIIGTVLLDFDADACQSPSRAYLLDVTLPGACPLSVNMLIVDWTLFSLSSC